MRMTATKTTDPLDGEIDFERFGPVRRNAFAGAGERGGPTLQALWEMPELPAGAVLLRRGHPGKGQSRKTVVRSIRLSQEIWNEVEAAAHKKHLNVPQALRAAVLGWLERTEAAAPTKTKKPKSA